MTENPTRARRSEVNTSLVLNEKKRLGAPLTEKDAASQTEQHSRRAFVAGGAAAILALLGYSWLKSAENTGIFSRVLRWNEDLSQDYFSPLHLAPEFPRSMAREPRVNGDWGLKNGLNPAEWRLNILGLSVSEPLVLNLDDIKQLPRVEMTTELKCIEGWSVIVNWAGARFSDFASRVGAPKTDYVSLVTPDGVYYVGWDMPSIMHPQTLLVYEMNGEPLTPDHGAPLRLVTTVKYGIKQIKRIGTIEFTNVRPADYWAEQGYDWYSGH
jgi:DMSO/TMAO reductase YedYZ molybdopterin-dependent catalytic subunit